MRRVGVTKAATALHNQKLLSDSRGNIEILDSTGMKAVSCRCYECYELAKDDDIISKENRNLWENKMKAAALVPLVLVTFTATFLGALLSEKGVINLSNKKAMRLQEPLLIEGAKQNGYSLLPTGTVLYFDKSWAEGHSTYHVYFHLKGEFKARPADGNGMDPIWLRTIDSDELSKLMTEYPVGREELTNILKVKRATKQDLVQIIRDWTD